MSTTNKRKMRKIPLKLSKIEFKIVSLLLNNLPYISLYDIYKDNFDMKFENLRNLVFDLCQKEYVYNNKTYNFFYFFLNKNNHYTFTLNVNTKKLLITNKINLNIQIVDKK